MTQPTPQTQEKLQTLLRDLDTIEPSIAKAIGAAIQGFIGEIGQLTDVTRQLHLTATLDFLVEKKTPASTKKSSHGGFDYGLIVHAWMFYRIARSITLNGLLPETQSLLTAYEPPVIREPGELLGVMANVNQSSLLTVALLHDLNKAMALNGEPHYVDNLLKSGERSEAKPWETNDAAGSPMGVVQLQLEVPGEHSWFQPFTDFEDGIKIRDGVISLAVAEKITPGIYATLSSDEKFAIVYHDGAYDGRIGLQAHETALQLVSHFADMFCARWLA